jgi:predicted negative regulator of RcsB-dependent stress response
MTTPNTPPSKRSGADDETMTEWFMLHQREVAWAVVAVAIIVGGFWYYQRSQSLKSQRAETAYFQARQSAAAGNLPLAASDLQKVVSRYEGTSSGTQAALTLAQMLYDQKKYKEGVAVLKSAESKASADFKPSIYALEAAGYEELKDLLAAAQQYKLAAQATRFPADKAEYQSAAARDYMAAGKTEEARAIWAELVKDENGPGAAEARVRLGELNAKPLKI